ncbi:syndecan-4-like [Corythoichthys intestinalis]|uniref:syndecan-4-like n=1 Tax=Corythoichthys intestinalis TaxID=161448 RepID=UPI0025A5D853|nr:syndecan-4-like [Corythoichthys intestinalis]XP_061789170.1 syndecan-4-like [Nerophis lumbriciformis]
MRTLWLLLLVGLAPGFISEKMLVSSQSLSFVGDDLYIEGQTSGDLPVDDEDGEDFGSGSGSGDYGNEDKETTILTTFVDSNKSEEIEMHPTRATASSTHYQPTKAADSRNPSTTVTDSGTTENNEATKDKEVPEKGPTADWFTNAPSPSSTSVSKKMREPDEDNSLERWDNSFATKDGDKDEVKDEVLTNEILVSRGSRRYDSPDDVTSESMWERTEVLAAVIACVVVGLLCAIFLLVLLAYRMKKKDEGSYDLGDSKLSTSYKKAPTKEFYA